MKQRDSRLERCPNPSWLTDASLPHCPAKAAAYFLSGMQAGGQRGSESKEVTETRRRLETKGTMSNVTDNSVQSPAPHQSAACGSISMHIAMYRKLPDQKSPIKKLLRATCASSCTITAKQMFIHFIYPRLECYQCCYNYMHYKNLSVRCQYESSPLQSNVVQ